MKRTFKLLMVAVLAAAGCASVPKSHAKRMDLEREASNTVQTMLAKDPGIQSLLDQAAGYVVFPKIKQGGFVVGGAGGEGVVFEGGRPTGYAELSQASFGAQIGGQQYAELIIVRDRWTLDKMKAGTFDMGAQASAVMLREGAASTTHFGGNGVAAIIDPLGGAMVNASVTGQQIKFKM